MDESTRGSDATRRRIYVVALIIAAPLMPVVGWLRADVEPFAELVYTGFTVGMLVALFGLLTGRLAVQRAEVYLVAGITAIVLVRLAGLTYGADLSATEHRVLVTETISPTLTALVLVIYLANDLRRARNGAIALWLAFTLIVAPRAVAQWADQPAAGFALLRQSLILAAVVGLAYGLATLKAQLAEERVRTRALDELASTDPLTGVCNRRGAQLALGRQIAIVERYGGDLSVALFDLDRFKQRNDHHGHAAGDEALVAIARALERELRASDVLGRWGGDELLVVAPRTLPTDAYLSAERWRRLIADLDLQAGPHRVTTSIGLASYRAGDTIDSILTRADDALYEAKRRGGDAVVTDGADDQDAADVVPVEERRRPGS